MADDTKVTEVEDKPKEKGAESAPLKAEDVMSGKSELADMYKSDMKERKEQYEAGVTRDTSSAKVLDRLSIVDGGVSLTRKPGRAADAGATKPGARDRAAGGAVEKAEPPASAKYDAGKEASAPPGGDWVDNVIDGTIQVAGPNIPGDGIAIEPLPKPLQPPPDIPGDGIAVDPLPEALVYRPEVPEVSPEQIEQLHKAIEHAQGYSIERNANGRPTEITNAKGETTTIEYSQDGKPIRITDGATGAVMTQTDDGFWVTQAADGSPIPVEVKDVQVGLNGDITVITGDGSTTVKHPDGSSEFNNAADGTTIKRNPDGNATEITDANGNTTTIEYGQDGKPVRITDEATGTVFTQTLPGVWVQSKDGEIIPTDPPIKDITVGLNGDITFVSGDGSTIIRHPDGTLESGTEGSPEAEEGGESPPDKEVESRVERDDQNRPTKVEYPDGTSNTIEYDQDGNITKMHLRDGSTMVREGDHWLVTKDGKTTRWNGEMHVSEEGDIASILPNGRTKVRGVDGSETIIETDQSQMTTDLQGRVTSVTYTDGTTNKIEYDEDGNVTKVHARDGSTIERDGDHWKVTTRDGETAVGDGEIVVSEEGDITHIGDDGRIDIRHRDGSNTVTNADQSQVVTDINGKVLSVTRPDLKTTKIEYGRDGEPRLIKNPDGTNWLKQGPYWNRYDRNGNRVEHHRGDIEVSENGDITMRKSDGSGAVTHLDGSKGEVPAEKESAKTESREAAPEAKESAPPAERKSEAPAEAPRETSEEMGRAGERSRDSGIATGKPVVVRDADGNVSKLTLPDGRNFEVDYTTDEHGNKVVQRVIFPDPDAGGRPRNIIASGNGAIDRDTMKSADSVENIRMDKDGTVTVVFKQYEDDQGKFHPKRLMTISPDGTYELRDISGSPPTVYERIDAKSSGRTKPVAQIDTLNADGSVTVKYGDRSTEKYARVERDASGNVVRLEGKMEPDGKGGFKQPDKSSLEIKEDGTTVKRDASGKVTEMTTADGETTTFKRDAKGGVTEVIVTNGQGKVVETRRGGIEVNDSDGSYTVRLTKEEADARKADGAEGTAEKLERKADGTERLLAKDGSEVKSDADKLLEKFKNYTPEQQRQLRQDLADIDRMPPEQREKIYASLDKIARNDEHPDDKIRLSGQQARELVQSLAHQIAHPESIEQGLKMTCTIASAEMTLAATHPEVYADMVAKLATDGEYKAADGSVVRVQGYENGKLNEKSDAFGQRSYASELFQNAGVQMGLGPNQEYVSIGPFEYNRIDPRPAGVTPATDMGERVIDRSTDPPTVKEFTGFKADKQAEILNKLVPGDKYHETKPIGQVDTPPPPHFDKEQGVKDLEKAVQDNGVPLNVGINLEAASGFSGMSRSEANHAVVITKIETRKNPETGKEEKFVYYENAAGGTDHSYPHGEGVPIDKFVEAMQASKMRALVRGGGGDTATADSGSAKAASERMGTPSVGDTTASGTPRDAQVASAPMGNPMSTAADRRLAEPPGDANTQKQAELREDLEKEEAEDAPEKTARQAAEVSKDPKEVAVEIVNAVESGQVSEVDIRNRLKDLTPEQQAKVREELQNKWHVNLYELMPDIEQRDKALDSIKNDADVKEDRERLEKLASEKIKNPQERQEFLENMQKFEGNMAAMQQEYQKQFEAQGMKPEDAAREAEKKAHDQVEKSYENMARLLETSNSAKIPEADRITLAKQTMQHAGDPKSISQGNHGTCNAATVETRTFAKDPAEATRLIADVATTGKYKTQSGIEVTLDEDSLKKQGQSNEVPPKERIDGHRDYASQIFQVTAWNVVLEKQNQSTDPPGEKRMVQYPEVAGKNPPPDDNGDYVVDYSQNDPETGKPPKKIDSGTGMVDLDISDMAREISPDSGGPSVIDGGKENVAQLEGQLLELELKDVDIVVTDDDNNVIGPDHPDYAKKAREAINDSGDLDDAKREKLNDLVNRFERHSNLEKEGNVVRVTSEEEMKDALSKAKREGRLPIIVSVDTNNEPFWSDSGGGSAGGSGGGHVVTITDYDPYTGTAMMQNQWSRGDSHRISAGDLFRATRDPKDNIPDLQKEVDALRQAGTPDYEKEFALLGLKSRTEQISGEEFTAKAMELAVERHLRQKQSGDVKEIKSMGGVEVDKEIEGLQKYLDQQRAEGKYDYYTEKYLLSLKIMNGKLTDKEISDELYKLFTESRQAAKDGKMDKDVFRDYASADVRELRDKLLPPAEQERLNERIKKAMQTEKK